MALTLVRHTTPDVAKGMCYGRTDLEVTAGFEEEAQRVVEDLPVGAPIVSSPLVRCRRLAQHIHSHVPHELLIVEHWIEMDFGDWEMTPWADIPRDGLDAWAADFMGYAGHGGESVSMLEARVRRAMSETPDGAIVVTHSGCIRAACAILGLRYGWETEVPFGGSVTLP